MVLRGKMGSITRNIRRGIESGMYIRILLVYSCPVVPLQKCWVPLFRLLPQIAFLHTLFFTRPYFCFGYFVFSADTLSLTCHEVLLVRLQVLQHPSQPVLTASPSHPTTHTLKGPKATRPRARLPHKQSFVSYHHPLPQDLTWCSAYL